MFYRDLSIGEMAWSHTFYNKKKLYGVFNLHVQLDYTTGNEKDVKW